VRSISLVRISSEPIERRPRDHHRVGSERERLQHIAPASKAAVDDERQRSADRSGDLGQHLDRRHAVIELPPAVIAQHQAVAAEVGRAPRIGHAEHTLDEELARPLPAQPRDVVPADRGVEQLRNDGAATHCARVAGREEVGEILKSRRPVTQQHLVQPARMAQHVEEVAHARLAGRAVVAPIPFPGAEHVGIGGEYQRLIARGRRARHDALSRLAVAHHVELHPQPSTGLRGHILQAHRRDGAQGERNTDRRRGPCEHHITARMHHAVGAGWGDHERRGDLAPEQHGALLPLAGIDEGRGDETQLLECRAIAAQGGLVLGAALDVLEDDAGDVPASDRAQIGDVERTREV